MSFSEKHPWLTWKNVHLFAVGCIVAGVAFAVVGAIIAGLEAHGWQDFVARLTGADLWLGGDVPEPPDVPSVPSAPSVP